MDRKVELQSAPVLSNSTVRLRKPDFEEAIWQMGVDVHHDILAKCPCTPKNSSASLTTCQNCKGYGWVVLERVKTKMMLTGMNRDTKFKDWGEENIGTVNVSTLNKDRLAYMDRITLLNGEAIHKELIYPKAIGAVGEEEWFDFTVYPALTVKHIAVFISGTTKLRKLIEGEYNMGDGKISFPDPSIFPINVDPSVSIIYTYRPEFLVIDLSRDIMNSGSFNLNKVEEKVDFPIAGVARRSHFVLDKLKFDGTGILDNTQ